MTDDAIITALAERVMGWTPEAVRKQRGNPICRLPGYHEAWNPLTDDSDAMTVLRAVGKEWPHFVLTGSWLHQLWDCYLQRRETDGSLTQVEGPTANSANRAICLAVLKAVGVRLEG